jgi:hypothetical protein
LVPVIKGNEHRLVEITRDARVPRSSDNSNIEKEVELIVEAGGFV